MSEEEKDIKRREALLVERAGIQTGEELKKFNEEFQQLQRDKMRRQILKQGGVQQIQGKTVYRNKDGVIVDKSELELTEKDKLRMANEQILKQFKGGVKQKELAQQRKQELEEAKEQPFSSHKLDPAVEQEIKNKERFGDPLKLIKSRNMKSEFSKQVYRVITTATSYKYVLPKCKYSAPYNRFSIEAGNRWDGVDRSNGYEKRWTERENEMKDNEAFHHKMATEDM